MKKISIILFSLVSLVATAQPNQWKLDTVKLINNNLLNIYVNVKTGATNVLPGGSVQLPPTSGPTGIFQDANRNVIIGIDDSLYGNCVNNFIQADGVRIHKGSNNSVFGKNITIDTADNVFAQVTDGHFLKGSHYSSGFGDALTIGGYSSITGGFGDINLNQYSAVFGNNNVAGSLVKPSSLQDATLWSNNYSGGGIIGQNIRTQGSDIIAIGRNFNSTQTGFHVGFFKTEFSVLPGDIIVFNGVQYHWPSTQPLPGSVLTYTGNGNLEWVAPTVTQRSNQQQPKPMAVVGLNGGIIGYTRPMAASF